MTAVTRGLITVLAAGAALLQAQTQPPPAPPVQTFRTATDVVMVDVAVRDGGRMVTGLRAQDFVVTDNGVRQRIDSVESAAVPIDLTLVVDLSGNPQGPWERRVAPSSIVRQLESEVNDVAGMLRPEDRIRLIAIDTEIHQVFPMRSPAAPLAIDRSPAGGMSALFDGLAAALLQPVEPARRHVVIARTKGLDTVSSIDAQALRAVAERSDALFHLVLMETALDNDAALRVFQCQFMGLCWPTRRWWIPFTRRLVMPDPTGTARRGLLLDGQAIAAGAEATGGGLHKASTFAEPTLRGTFRKAFEDFRSSYVLRYTPSAPQGGWHTIHVSVPASKSYSVRARKGYLVERPPAPATAPAPPAVLEWLADFTAAYQRGAYGPVVEGLRRIKDPLQMLRDFEVAGNPWPANPRREAVFALELAEAAVYSAQAATREAGVEMLTRFSRLVRHPLEPDAFERYWHFALLTLLEGSVRPAVTEPFAERALARFPDEPRFLLSRAIAADQKGFARQASVVDASGRPTAAHAETVRRYYDAAMTSPATTVEARIRLAGFLLRLGRPEESLALLTAAGAQSNTDRALEYLRQLFTGHALSALQRHEEAIVAYRAAMTVVPSAQAARVALMNALLVGGDRAGAEELGEQVQAQKGTEIDPWWMYWQGQYRVHPQAMARLREMAR